MKNERIWKRFEAVRASLKQLLSNAADSEILTVMILWANGARLKKMVEVVESAFPQAKSSSMDSFSRMEELRENLNNDTELLEVILSHLQAALTERSALSLIIKIEQFTNETHKVNK